LEEKVLLRKEVVELSANKTILNSQLYTFGRSNSVGVVMEGMK
jgi:hypothetical protein